jgi:adenylate cyclase
MGDEVNFGSRLEGLNKMYGTECIVSESVANSLRGKGFVIRELDYVMVKGKKEPKKIFELISGEVGNDRNNALDMFAKGFEAYKKGDWDVALNHFNEALVQYPDKPSQVFKERTEKLKSNPPTSWTGAYEHTSK